MGKSAARQGSVERFIKRFNRDIEDPDDISEKHLVLRRLLLKKYSSLSQLFKKWR
jgi:hypothetical protein